VLRAAFRRHEIEDFSAVAAVEFLVFVFLYRGGTAFRAMFFKGWRFFFLPSLAGTVWLLKIPTALFGSA
jgi:hypothetical protein